MGRPRKDPDKRQRRNVSEVPADARAALEQAGAAPELQVEPPAADRAWLKVTKDAWTAWWTSDHAKHVTVPDLRALLRLFRMYDLEERAGREVTGSQEIAVWVGFDDVGDGVYDRRRVPADLALGSQGQLVKHPSAELMLKYGAEIRQLEDRFGITPRSRYQLGFTFGAAGNTMMDLNARIAAAAASQSDPRQIDQRADAG